MTTAYRFSGGERLTATKLNTFSSAIEKREMTDQATMGKPYLLPSPDIACRQFAVEIASTTSVRVYRGYGKIAGNLVALTCDGGETFKTITAINGTSETYYIYITVDAVTPAVTADKTTTLPTLENQFVVATITTSDAGTIATLAQHYLGDIFANGDVSGRWDMSKKAALTMTVGAGRWRRNNVDISWAGGDVVLASGTNTHFLYFELDDSTGANDPALIPDRFATSAIKSATTIPSDTYNKILVVGSVAVTDSAITSYTQFLFSDCQDWCDTPDKGVQATHPSETLERNANGGWQLVDADESASREKYAKLDSANKLTWVSVTVTDELVATASGNTPGYIGTSNTTGVIRCDGTTIKKVVNVADTVELQVILNESGSAISGTRGLPAGGSQYQALTKNSATDYDVKWDWIRAH